ncbi:Deoxynucleoside triphosphate triphosphohydrolase SAMHD1 [Galdieria sulphuraria]|nr:Deoxynucleoside triphosphate triphosphohydrolase SAMHD1 [Galdieria sulphuraria]
MDTLSWKNIVSICYYVFPGATHCRFEHSLGVCYLAGAQLEQLYYKQKSEIFENDEEFQNYCKLVRIAGLCHDLGHGPFSHSFDDIFLRKKFGSLTLDEYPQLRHEYRSIQLLENLIESNSIDIDRQDLRIIGELIQGSSTLGQSSLVPPFLYQIVSNKYNSVDVDKFDYLVRDTRATGLKFGFDHSRLMQYCRVVDNWICYHQKEIFNMYDMFNLRFKLHKIVYNHRTSKAIDYMLMDILLHADAYFDISNSIFDNTHFVRMTDSILYSIEHSREPSLGKSREILHSLRKRELYKFVCELLVPSHIPDITEEEVTSHQNTPQVDLRPEDIIVQNMRANYAMKEKNPVDNVLFFRNWEDRNPVHIPREHVSYLIPDVFEEHTVRLYSKSRDPLIIQAAKKAFQMAVQCYLDSSDIKKQLDEQSSSEYHSNRNKRKHSSF